ncbi:MAG: hypothetical protein V4692_13480 [Bdellovibrionota bacterium]
MFAQTLLGLLVAASAGAHASEHHFVAQETGFPALVLDDWTVISNFEHFPESLKKKIQSLKDKKTFGKFDLSELHPSFISDIGLEKHQFFLRRANGKVEKVGGATNDTKLGFVFERVKDADKLCALNPNDYLKITTTSSAKSLSKLSPNDIIYVVPADSTLIENESKLEKKTQKWIHSTYPRPKLGAPLEGAFHVGFRRGDTEFLFIQKASDGYFADLVKCTSTGCGKVLQLTQGPYCD